MSNFYKRVPGEGETKSLGAIDKYLDNLQYVVVPYKYPINLNPNSGKKGKASMKEIHESDLNDYSMPSFVQGTPYSLDELSHLDLMWLPDNTLTEYFDIIINNPGPEYEPFQLTDGVLG